MWRPVLRLVQLHDTGGRRTGQLLQRDKAVQTRISTYKSVERGPTLAPRRSARRGVGLAPDVNRLLGESPSQPGAVLGCPQLAVGHEQCERQEHEQASVTDSWELELFPQIDRDGA